MTPDMKERAREALDSRFGKLPDPTYFQRPASGWIRAIRQSLGMTTAQLAKRLGVSQPRIPALEKAESGKSITLESLERAARALDCELVYAFVPRSTLQDQIDRRSLEVARRRLTAVQHTMTLEDQSVGARENNDQIARLARALAEKSGPELWRDE